MAYNCNTESRRGFGIYDERNCCDATSGLNLAIATVPMQTWRKLFDGETALMAGTMFEELYLPFMGGGLHG